MEISQLTTTEVTVIKPINFESIKVDFGAGIVAGFAETYVSAINNKMAKVGNNVDFEKSDMEKYLNFLLISRVKSMNSKVDFDIRYLNVPALYALTLSQVGKVYDKLLGVELVPFIDSKDEAKLISFDIKEALAFSRKLALIEDFSFELVRGLPRDKEGSQEFMFFHISENMVLRHEGKTHSGFAILTSFFKMKQLESVLTHRVVYGTVNEYDRMLEDLIYRN